MPVLIWGAVAIVSVFFCIAMDLYVKARTDGCIKRRLSTGEFGTPLTWGLTTFVASVLLVGSLQTSQNPAPSPATYNPAPLTHTPPQSPYQPDYYFDWNTQSGSLASPLAYGQTVGGDPSATALPSGASPYAPTVSPLYYH